MTGTVLIVDDSLTVRMDLAEAFAAAGIHTLPCATLAEARLTLAREPIAVVILDVQLPDGDGTELLGEIRTTPALAKTYVLMLSVESEVKSRIRGLQIGADDYVGKPYDTGFVLARVKEVLRRRESTPSHPAGGATVPTTVLIIDDSVTYRTALCRTLEGSGYEVIVAASGEEGLRMAADLRPMALIVDGIMSGIDGATVIRTIRLDAALRRTPCLMLTGSEDADSELHALDSGADAFVRKEEEPEVILARLAAVLRNAHQGESHEKSLLGPKRILAVDDSMTYLQELGAALRTDGYDVVLAHSGEEAIDMVGAQAVDCILMDLLMPGIGGKEACRRIKEAPSLRDTEGPIHKR